MKLKVTHNGEKLALHFGDVAMKYSQGKKSVYAKMAVMTIRDIQDNFRKHGRPKPWKPIGKRWKKRRGSKGVGRQPLRDTGNLFHSQRLLRLQQSGYDVGTTVPYAPDHNFGASVPKQVFRNVKFKKHAVKAHTRQEHTVKEHSRTQKGKTITIPAHQVKAHKVKRQQRGPFRRVVIIKAHKIPQREFMIIPQPQNKILFDFHNAEIGKLLN